LHISSFYGEVPEMGRQMIVHTTPAAIGFVDPMPLGGLPQRIRAQGGRTHDVPVRVVLWSQDDDA
jgi:hypothetical protein